jgi:2-polyprenyl-3-methyl-5-hydroxy-6-metoxy-1,4-benzoquinol methylase
VVEIGCGHGVLLKALKQRGYECVGVEPDRRVAAWTQQRTGVDMRVGLFPDVKLPSCDLLMAFDVLEHSPYPNVFLQEAAKLLHPRGMAIFQTPIDHHDSCPPFSGSFANVFDDLEHQYVFTSESLEKLIKSVGMEIVARATGVRKDDIVALRKRQGQLREHSPVD